jgi:GGDEF domain-containing protein
MIYSSERDSLTGLPNRMLLNDRVNQARPGLVATECGRCIAEFLQM